ncbi:hypothetical protein EDM80_06740 [bacterium]|nr:MAG: hypothetical protein EDM80_06740 [bacterium]RIK63914.1 MAG: hypothetical protein DCC64_05775 [Planctomycetota bacterium]
MNKTLPFLLLLLAPCLLAQEKRDPGLAAAYPSTTIVYVEGNVASLFKSLSDPGLLKGVGANVQMPDLGQLVEESLEIELTDAEVRQIVGGIQRGSFGLLDFGVGGPKFQLVVRHEDPSVLAKALARALEQGAETVVSVEEYEGEKAYQIKLPVRAPETDPEGMVDRNPILDWAAIETLWLTVTSSRHVIVATSLNAAKDAIEFLAFPDDPTDTLRGNKRFQEALADFKDPDGLVFVNTTALINTLERASGDKGNSPMEDFFGGAIRFTIELLEYKQLKSFAAGYWIDDATNTLRMDARLQFHNEPGWYSAVKLKPTPQPLSEFIPADTMLGLTYGIDDPKSLYTRVMDLLRTRATDGGQADVLKELNKFESRANSQGVPLTDVLEQVSNGQAYVVLAPEQGNEGAYSLTPNWALLLALRDKAKAEEFLFEKLLKSDIGSQLRQAELEVTVHGGVEIHHAPATGNANPVAFALYDGVFMLGDLQGVRRVVAARQSGRTLATMGTFKQARDLLWEKCGAAAYLNLGAIVKAMDFQSYFTGQPKVIADATEADANPIPYLSRFFGGTVIAIGTQARDNELAMRAAVAGWPSPEQFRTLAEHFRDVGRNKEVRNAFAGLLEAATTHYAIKGKPAAKAGELAAAGYIQDTLLQDPFREEGESRPYELAKVPDNLDIRQAVLLAYQQKPGLEGAHLGVLWNGYIVKLTPAQLKAAIERAGQGLPLENYEALEPLFLGPGTDSSVEDPMIDETEVEIIDDDGTERVVSVPEDNLTAGTEHKLDNPPPKEEK